MSQLVTIEEGDAVATVTINRPDKLNALDPELLDALASAFGGLRTRAAILTGAGKAFVAGADIAAMAEMTPVEARRFSAQGQALCRQLESLAFPVIAAVNGFALGGGLELAMACDFIYCAEGAKLGQPEVTLAVLPGFGGTQRLLRRVGMGHARELVYTGALIDAAEALRIGLVNKVFAREQLLAEAKKTTAQIAAVGPLAVEAAKRVMRHGEGMALDAACEHESEAFAGLFGSDDQRAGMRAFVQKQKTTFSGR